MVITFERSTSLASVLVLSVISTLVRSQAPDDTDAHSCDQFPAPDGVFRLLDSSWYELLYTTSATSDTAGWTMTPADSWTEAGSFCARRLASCDSTSSNWLVTQYISKSAQASYALGITVDLNGEVTHDCTEDPSCSDAVNVYYYPSNGPITSGQQLNTNNYQSIGSVSFGFTTETKSVTFSLGSEFDRFYIAIKEENSCFTLRNLKVSYGLCSAMEDGLVVYPNAPIGSTSVPASASCKANAAVSPGSSLDITCNTDGTFTGSPSCSCLAGYIGATCFPCASGSYAEFGDTICTPCPANSMSASGSASCSCITGYYRASADSITDACTIGPGPTSGLRVTSVRGTNVDLEWDAAVMTGGRTDIFYRFGYRTEPEDPYTLFNPPSRITDTMGTLSNLSAHTTYSVVVVTENGVSFDRPSTFPVSERMSNEVVVTTQSGGSATIGSLWVTAIAALLAVAFLFTG